MAKQITIHYSEDFRENKIAGKVYGILRDNHFDPIKVSTIYSTTIGDAYTDFSFLDGAKLPEKQKLENMLKGISLREIIVK